MDGHLLRFNKDITYGFIDLETFNLMLHFCHNRPWQVGMLEVKADEIVGSYDLRVNWPDAPHLKIGNEAAMITRYSQQEQDRLAVLPEEAFRKFWPILEEVDYIVGHNILRFDLYLLKGYAEHMRAPWKWIMPKIIDTKSIAQGIKMQIPYKPEEGTFLEYQYRMANIVAKGIKTSLKTLGPELGIVHDYERLHDALVDLELNLKVWNKLKLQLDI